MAVEKAGVKEYAIKISILRDDGEREIELHYCMSETEAGAIRYAEFKCGQTGHAARVVSIYVVPEEKDGA